MHIRLTYAHRSPSSRAVGNRLSSLFTGGSFLADTDNTIIHHREIFTIYVV
jgi:hypothetical protein